MAVVINGSGTVSGLTAQASDIELTDDTKIKVGDSDDLQIYHDGSHSYIKDGGTGNLQVCGSTNVNIQKGDASEYMAKFIADGSVDLYYDNSKKLATTSTGVDITGAVTVNGSALASGLYASVAIICDEKAYNVSGGTFTSGAWRTRDLNTEVSDADGIVSISSNQFTLAAGTYTIDWSAPAYAVNFHTTVLYDITNSLFKQTGMAIHCSNPNDVYGVSSGSATVTISGSTAYEIRHQCSRTQSGNGFGVDVGFNGGLDKSIYTIVKILKHS